MKCPVVDTWNVARVMARAPAVVLLLFVIASGVTLAQGRRKPLAPRKTKQASDTVEKLREDYIKATKEYKETAERLLAIHQANAKKAQDRLAQSQRLFAEGLISKRELEDSQRAVDQAQARVAEVGLQINQADTQVAETLLEVETDRRLAKARIPRGGLVRTTSFIRFNGAATWLLSNSGTIQGFFQQRFHKPLPIAVFGQGEIHNRWRLDHRNAMDISLHPDSDEGQALLSFLRNNGIPFSAFRSAIPGTATGPHIHIGLPSHRY